MKKLVLFIAVATAVSFASCKKQTCTEPAEGEEVVVEEGAEEVVVEEVAADAAE